MVQNLTNRDTAYILISFFLSLYFLYFIYKNPEIRFRLIEVYKAFLNKYIIVPLIILTIYLILIVYFLYSYDVWNLSLMKDTLIWYLSFFFFTYLTLNTVNNTDDFKEKIINLFSITLVIDFLINSYTFNLYVEILLTFIVIFIRISMTIVNDNEKTKLGKIFLKYILYSIYILYLINFIFKYQQRDFINNIKYLELILLFILGLLYLPFMYFTALYIKYENAFQKIDSLTMNKKYRKSTKLKILKECRLSLNRINKF